MQIPRTPENHEAPSTESTRSGLQNGPKATLWKLEEGQPDPWSMGKQVLAEAQKCPGQRARDKNRTWYLPRQQASSSLSRLALRKDQNPPSESSKKEEEPWQLTMSSWRRPRACYAAGGLLTPSLSRLDGCNRLEGPEDSECMPDTPGVTGSPWTTDIMRWPPGLL